MVSNKNLTLGGCALLVVGLFCPIVTVPFLGNINLFNNGTSLIALALLALAVVSGAMALNGRERDALWPGLASAALLLYHFVALQYRLSQMRSSMNQLKDNPFAGLAKTAVGTIQLQWGWLILATGTGLLIYAAAKTRRENDRPLLSVDDGPAKTVASVSISLSIAVIGWTLFGSMAKSTDNPSAATGTGSTATAPAGLDAPSTEAEGPSVEEAAYIRDNLRLYDLEAKYYDSMLDGRVPGVDFKLKNNGTRTLNQVTVKVVFQDAQGKPIAEEEYNPVIVVEHSFSGDNTPLRPNYIWQNEKGHFYSAKSVPSEWAEGKATATITAIEFAPSK